MQFPLSQEVASIMFSTVAKLGRRCIGVLVFSSLELWKVRKVPKEQESSVIVQCYDQHLTLQSVSHPDAATHTHLVLQTNFLVESVAQLFLTSPEREYSYFHRPHV